MRFKISKLLFPKDDRFVRKHKMGMLYLGLMGSVVLVAVVALYLVAQYYHFRFPLRGPLP